jgi:hypothetical protein
MWLTDLTRRPVTGSRPPTEAAVAAALAGPLAAGAGVIGMVVDARAPGARAGAPTPATANYRLQRALALPRAAPVACWSRDPVAAWHTVALLLAGLPPQRCALLVACPGRAPYEVAGALVWRGTDRSAIPVDADGAARLRTPTGGDGFLLMLAAADRPLTSTVRETTP